MKIKTKNRDLYFSFTNLDKFLLSLLIFALVGSTVTHVFNLKITLPPPKEPIAISPGSQVDWEEYKSFIGNRTALRKYVNVKSVAEGYIANIPTEKNGAYYKLFLTKDRTDSTAYIQIQLGRKEYLKGLTPGQYRVIGSFDIRVGYGGLAIDNPTLIRIGP